MSEIELQLPSPQHQIAAEDFKREFFEAREFVINGSALLDQMDYELWLTHTTNNRQENKTRPDWVTATTFFAVRQSDDRIVGILDIRHNLNHDFLTQYGGHIGYAVRPCERKKGYATDMLRMGLTYAKTLGIARIMLGCYTSNLPSVKTIVKNGGVLSETKPLTDGKLVNIYWIETT